MFKLRYLTIFTITFLLGSCTAFLEIEPPNSQMLTNSVFSTDETATAAMISVYMKMIDDGMPYYVALACGYSSDELQKYTNNIPLTDLYLNNSKPADAFSNQIWNNAFFYIYQANSVIEGCEGSNKIAPNVKKQLLGEAHFIRAFWMYYLTSFFGDIPLVLSTNYQENTKLKRSSSDLIYEQIVADLKFSISNLGPTYISGIGKSTTIERTRPNQAAAQAFLARIYLTLNNWNEAMQMADLVINNVTLYDTVIINEVFLANNKEAIWQIPSINNIATREGYGFILESKPQLSTAQISCSTLSTWLLDAFETGDRRKDNWIGLLKDESDQYQFPYKYKQRMVTSSMDDQSTVLRLAEQYLIRAESKARTGDFIGALNDINVIRKRAGLSAISTGSTEIELLQLIKKERQVELFTEWGHRWIDLKRMGYVDEVMPQVISDRQGVDWSNKSHLWPLPQTEIDRNPNFEQNMGYFN
ncbi:MAG: RagB/SusD family nutrient uptake outer membrane protein [Crocinitomicaceae bacterium]|nr:RagB/SusD family nutrient uptake outer membrane protein [Crocinitomicaceae bacterium]